MTDLVIRDALIMDGTQRVTTSQSRRAKSPSKAALIRVNCRGVWYAVHKPCDVAADHSSDLVACSAIRQPGGNPCRLTPPCESPGGPPFPRNDP